MKEILVIGSLNTDFSVSVDTIPAPGETVNANNLILNNGGKGANQAYTIGKLNGKVSMLGIVGKDIYGKNLKKSLKSVKVNVSNIMESKEEETGKAFINVSKDGENAISIVHGANYLADDKFILKNKKLIDKADIILMQLEIPLSGVKKTLELSKDKMIILDPAPANKEIMNFNLSNVYLMKPNESELQTLTEIKITDEQSIIKATRVLTNKGVKNVIVSLGDKGCYLVDKDNYKFFNSIKVEAVDTTAAGDAFLASIALRLSLDDSLDEAILFASKVSSLVVQKKGAQDSIPSIKEIK